MNSIILQGRVARIPELKQTQAGNAYCRFSIAVNRRFKNPDGTTTADFFNCTAFNGTAEVISKYFHKGSRIVVRGSLQNNNWTDEAGTTHYDVQVMVDEVAFIDTLAESQQGSTGTTQQAPAQQAPPAAAGFDASLDGFIVDMDESDLPF